MTQGEFNTNERNEAAQDEMLSAILQKLGANTASRAASGGASPPTQSGSGDQGASAAASGSGDILSSLLSNPDLIAKLPTIISSIKPIVEMLGRSNSPASETVATAALPVQSPPASTEAAKVDRGSDSRTALLCAMKPYLSEERRNAIDYIVKIGRLGDILKTL